MYKERIIAWGCGIIAFLLVMILGKSCMSVPESSKKKGKDTSDSVGYAESTDSNDGFGIIYPTASPDEQKDEIVLDMFGRPVRVTEPPEEEMPTDEEGNPIEPPTEIYTDEDGNIIEPPTEENTDDMQSENDENSEDDNVSEDDEELSDEQIDDEQSDENEEDEDEIPIPPGFSGYDHKEYDNEGNEKATVPPDFVIVIE